VPEHIRTWSTTDGPTSLVADRALASDDNRQRLAEPPRPWMTRVPAPVPDAHTALAPVIPETMPPGMAGDRDQEGRSTDTHGQDCLYSDGELSGLVSKHLNK
jgi:hypothetical protein